jgi:uncharacterized surface protein with fasciclin (FAS1) repeats
MRISRTWRVLAAGAALAFVLSACSSDDDGESSSTTRDTTASATTDESMNAETIADVASGNPDFSTLVTAVQKADLAETLSGDGPFTVFAPTNDAFAKIPAEQLNPILADKEQLTEILTYHVLPAKVRSSDLQPQQSVATVQGENVDIAVANGSATINATINGCNIVDTDIEASNGVVHVIDCVLTPPA